jgi:D-sedoheptulose 7-phosphate isomerase
VHDEDESRTLTRTSEYLEEVSGIAAKLDRASIDRAIELLYSAWKNDNQVFVIGNGGSASTATHFACDLNKWVSDEAERKYRAFALVDNIPLVSALTNDNGWSDVYIEQLRNFLRKGDVLVAISVHGGSGSDKAGPWSQNLLKAVKYVKDNGGKVVGLSGFDGGVLKTAADACIVVPASSTPHVEGMHLVLTHLISEQLRERISKQAPRARSTDSR